MSETDIMLDGTSFTAATLRVIRNMADKIRDTQYQTSPELIASLQEASRAQKFYLQYTEMTRSFAVALGYITTPGVRLWPDNGCKDCLSLSGSLRGMQFGIIWHPDTTDKERVRCLGHPLVNDQQTQLAMLAQHLLHEIFNQQSFPRCELVSMERSHERCRRKATAVRWHDGFADYVCIAHANSARRQGAIVIEPRRHDGITPDLDQGRNNRTAIGLPPGIPKENKPTEILSETAHNLGWTETDTKEDHHG